MKIVCSLRNFFPKGGLFYSLKKQASLAKQVGYNGIYILPTWSIVLELLTKEKLSVSEDFLFHGHRDWRFDRIMEAKVKNKPWWFYQLRNKEDWLFPPSDICLKGLKKYQEVYRQPVSVMWFEDTNNFSPVTLELWNKMQGINHQELLRWLNKDRKNRGISLDTLKFPGWLESNNLQNKEDEVLEQILPYVINVDYRSTKKKREKSLAVTQGKIEESDRLFKLILKKGYKGSITVEFGWPDLQSPPFGIFREDLSSFYKLHKNIIHRIKSWTPLG